jgi:hypothetical protein
MAATFVRRPGFDHVVRLKCRVDRLGHGRRNRIDYLLSADPLVQEFSDETYLAFLNQQGTAIEDWLAKDHAQGRYTHKFFLNQVLVSFEDADTGFAFKMRFG